MQFFQLCAMVALFAIMTNPLLAQAPSVDLHEGTHFVVAFGQVWNQTSEQPLADPFQLVVNATTDGDVFIEYGPANARTKRGFQFKANRTLRITVPTVFVHPIQAGVIEMRTVTVTSTAPISLCSSIGFHGNGNQTLHYPVAAWDKSYWAFSYPQDTYGNEKHRPGQLTVIASEDSTIVTITSPATIDAGASIPKPVTAKKPFSIVLNAHECITIVAKIIPDLSHDARTDLTGTHVTSSKPIAVVSGHTKGAVGIYYKYLPLTGAFASEAHFIRNSFTQSLLPNALADTAFITVPLMYTATRRVYIIDSTDHGYDEIRILATEDNTTVSRQFMDGTAQVILATLNAGEYYSAIDVTEPQKWSSSKPVHVMQYGASLAVMLPPGGIVAKGELSGAEASQGHPTVESGQPTMIVVPGLSRWVRSAKFDAPEGMDNFVNMVVATADIQHVISPWTAGQFRPIGQTGYSYLRAAVGSGQQAVSMRPDANLAGPGLMIWNYGSLDGLQQGRAYGHPAAVNLMRACQDSIVVSITKHGNTADVIASVDTTCSSMLWYKVVSYDNAGIDSSVQKAPYIRLSLSLLDTTTNGSITLQFQTSGGQNAERTIDFQHGPVDVDDEPVIAATMYLSAHPQPASDIVTITYGTGLRGGSVAPVENGSLRIYDIGGRCVADLSEMLRGGEGILTTNTSDLTIGVYFIQLSNGVHRCVQRLIVP